MGSWHQKRRYEKNLKDICCLFIFIYFVVSILRYDTARKSKYFRAESVSRRMGMRVKKVEKGKVAYKDKVAREMMKSWSELV